jgi:hypothetical protein
MGFSTAGGWAGAEALLVSIRVFIATNTVSGLALFGRAKARVGKWTPREPNRLRGVIVQDDRASGELPPRAAGRLDAERASGQGQGEAVKAGGARVSVLASRVRDRSGEGPADVKKPRAVPAGAVADLVVYDGMYGKPFSRSSTETIGTSENYRKRQARSSANQPFGTARMYAKPKG